MLRARIYELLILAILTQTTTSRMVGVVFLSIEGVFEYNGSSSDLFSERLRVEI